MKWSVLIAALAALGGLAGPASVDAHLREAAPPPERDFRQLIDMVRNAISAAVNFGKLPNDRVYVCLEAIYSDRAVIEMGGKYFQYTYAITNINGADQVVLGAPTEVVETYVPVAGATQAAKAVKAAAASGSMVETLRAALPGARFVEAEDGSIVVTLINAGASLNGNYYPDVALREAVPLFEGVRVFAKSDADHIQGRGKDVRNLVGGIYGVQFVEGKSPDTGALVGTFKPLDPKDAVAVKMVEAVKRGMQNLLGLSIDAVAKTKKRVQGGKTLREATKFTKVSSVDLIVEPGAGGGLDRLTEAAAETSLTGESTMPLWKQRMLEAIKKVDQAKLANVDEKTVSDEQLFRVFEAVFPGSSAAAAVLTLSDPNLGAAASGGQRLAEAAGNEPITRAELAMVELRGKTTVKIQGSKLPQVAKDKLATQFSGMATFTEANVDEAIKAEGEYLARFTESGSVRVPMFGAGAIVVGDRSVQVKDMLDAFFDPAHKNHRDVHSFKECYVEITGDRRVTGHLENCDRSRLAESLGHFAESVDSTTFANALGVSITRRMQAIYAGMTDLQSWRQIATWGPVNDFRTNERVRIGGYGNLPAVAQGAAYAALSSPADAKATYAVSKRGGTEDVTMEAIKNDDVQALRRIPGELALAAGNTIYEFVFDFLRANAAIYDSVALFHASHNNLFTTALSAAELSVHRLARLKQTRAGSAKRLATPPKSIVVPLDLQEAAINLFNRNTNLDKTFQNTWNMEVIGVSYWTDANDWCTVADPARFPAIELGFLDGKEDPELFVQDMPNVGSMFSNDKLTYKIRHIYGGAVLVDGEKALTKAVVP